VAQEQKRLIQLAKHDAEILGSSNDLEIASEFILPSFSLVCDPNICKSVINSVASLFALTTPFEDLLPHSNPT